MPILDLTADLEAEMPELGTLRKGAPKPKNSKAPGKDLDHFRFVCNDPDIDRRFHEVYGNEPRVINVHLPFDTLEQNFPTWNKEYGSGSLKHQCDGKTMVLWQDDEGMYHTEPKACPYADLPKGDPRRKCKQTGLLRVIIDELGEWGYVNVVTGGKWDCIGLTQNVLEVKDMARRASAITGRPIGVQGIPCQVKREPRMTSCPPREKGGKRIRQEKWMLYLYVRPDYIKALMEYMNQYALPVVDLPQLESPDLDVDYYVGNGDNDNDIEYPEAEVVDEPEPDKAELEQLKAAFFKRMLSEIPFFTRPQEIGKALKAAGFTAYSQTKEDKMLAALQEHANQAANKEAQAA